MAQETKINDFKETPGDGQGLSRHMNGSTSVTGCHHCQIVLVSNSKL